MSNDELAVRGMRLADAPALFRLCHDLGYEPDKEGFHGQLENVANDVNQALFVAVAVDDEPRGFVHVFGRHSIEIAPCAQIQALVVGKRERRTGAGNLLTGAAEEWARARGFSWISLYCTTNRDAAHGFYEAAGYDLAVTASRFSKLLD